MFRRHRTSSLLACWVVASWTAAGSSRADAQLAEAEGVDWSAIVELSNDRGDLAAQRRALTTARFAERGGWLATTGARRFVDETILIRDPDSETGGAPLVVLDPSGVHYRIELVRTRGFTEVVRIDGPGGPCSGTRIAPTVVLTSAHCLFGEVPPGIREGLPGVTALWVDGGLAELTRVVAMDAWSDTRVDLAFLKHGAIASTAPLRLASIAPAAPAQRTRVTAVGYGCTSEHARDHGLKHSLDFPWKALTIPFVCGGDSGGPVLFTKDGDTQVIAVMRGFLDARLDDPDEDQLVELRDIRRLHRSALIYFQSREPS
jgi:hypothetical protein